MTAIQLSVLMEALHEYRREDVERFPVKQLCQLLCDLQYSTELLQNVRENAVTGNVFLQLSDEQLKEIAPKLGDRVRLKRLQTELLRDAFEKVRNTQIDYLTVVIPIMFQ